ncbi:MAG TPA: DUF4399 domain-containing protein [Rudaea sp.]|nr:DUF4399 domain-containing protein [Rudaea sp.]
MRIAAIVGAGLAMLSTLAVAQNSTNATAMLQPKAPQGAKVFFVAPKDGATVGRDVHVEFGVTGIKLEPATNVSSNSGHHHLLIDVGTLPAMNAPIPSDAHHLHFGKGQTETTIRLSPGEHTLQLDFGNYAHMQFDPPIVSKKITIHVK